uniref:Uncharacterized protein n=2 Tax=Capitella teleta TaxID=283909 RepID=X1ZI71_CAPTE
MDKNKNKHLFPKFSKFDHVVFTQSSLNCEDRFLQRFVMENKATRLVRHLNGGIDDPELSNVIMEYFCGNEDSDDVGRRKTALVLEDVKHLVSFIVNYADQNALVLPGRVPGFARDDIKILPSSTTKVLIWRLYFDCPVPEGSEARKVKLSTFKQLWLQLLPFIVVARPMTDLCWTCQNNNAIIH